MSLALKCDRCGELFEYYVPDEPKKNKHETNKFFDIVGAAYAFAAISPRTGRYDGYKPVLCAESLDLCPKCRESFIEWFNSPESK